MAREGSGRVSAVREVLVSFLLLPPRPTLSISNQCLHHTREGHFELRIVRGDQCGLGVENQFKPLRGDAGLLSQISSHQFPQSPFAAVSDDRVPDFSSHRETDPGSRLPSHSKKSIEVRGVVATTFFIDSAELPVVAKPRGETRVFHARIHQGLIKASIQIPLPDQPHDPDILSFFAFLSSSRLRSEPGISRERERSRRQPRI